MCDGGINLRSADILMPQQLTDSLDCHSLRKGDRRGKGMAGRVERNVPRNACQGHDAFEADVAPAVTREVEYLRVTLPGLIFQQDGIRNGENPHIDGSSGFATCRTDPQLFTILLNVLGGKQAEVDIGESGEATEQKRIPHQL